MEDKAIIKIKETISRKPADLVIYRVPKPTLDKFRELADKEFCSDYGMALKFLFDFYSGIISTGLEKIQVDIEVLKAEIADLKAKKQEEQKPRSTMTGQRIGG